MTRRLRDAVRDHFAAHRMQVYGGERSPWIFHHTVNRRRAIVGERIKCLRRGFEGATKRAGLPNDLNQHDLRHRRVTTWLQGGHPILKVRDAMGHSTVRVTEGYLHLVSTDLLSLVEPLTDDEEWRFSG